MTTVNLVLTHYHREYRNVGQMKTVLTLSWSEERETATYLESFFAVLSSVLQCEVAVMGCYGDTV